MSQAVSVSDMMSGIQALLYKHLRVLEESPTARFACATITAGKSVRELHYRMVNSMRAPLSPVVWREQVSFVCSELRVAGANISETEVSLALQQDGLTCFETYDTSKMVIDMRELFITAKPLGEGSFGSVTSASFRGVGVAVKRLNTVPMVSPDVIRDTLLNQVHVLGHVVHPNIAQVIGVVLQPPHFCLVTELLDRSLHDALHGAAPLPFTIAQRWLVLDDIMCGVAFLHATLNVCHRDLKPANVMLTTHCVAKLIDFDLVARVPEMGTFAKGEWGQTNLGTLPYMAPELLSHPPLPAGRHSDVYALAIMATELLTNNFPYPDGHPATLGQQVLQGRRPNLPHEMPERLRLLLATMWHFDPNSRPVADVVLQQHRAIIELDMELSQRIQRQAMIRAAAIFAAMSPVSSPLPSSPVSPPPSSPVSSAVSSFPWVQMQAGAQGTSQPIQPTGTTPSSASAPQHVPPPLDEPQRKRVSQQPLNQVPARQEDGRGGAVQGRDWQPGRQPQPQAHVPAHVPVPARDVHVHIPPARYTGGGDAIAHQPRRDSAARSPSSKRQYDKVKCGLCWWWVGCCIFVCPHCCAMSCKDCCVSFHDCCCCCDCCYPSRADSSATEPLLSQSDR